MPETWETRAIKNGEITKDSTSYNLSIDSKQKSKPRRLRAKADNLDIFFMDLPISSQN